MSAQHQDRPSQQAALAAKGRLVSIVILVTMGLWLLALWLGPKLGLPGRYAFLFDFAALAGLFWALIVSFQIRRARKAQRGNE
ncbi:DUF5337 domain-containing protein [uncultured Roseobacter sp.]|uniref:DUF5337 domain-containing protein n=1 Tax=uncultured Roseobacter sp. TaxID=114847 RepID=UPI00261D2016|nr:DUF5337 domain-containing protein [uncultured Roseobacter sp.]